MTTLRACIVPASLLAGLVVIAPAQADNSNLPTFSMGQSVTGETGRVVAASSDYLIMDMGTDVDRKIWDVQAKSYIVLASDDIKGPNPTSISGNVVVGNVNGTTPYQWVMTKDVAGTHVTGTALTGPTGSAIYGNSGSIAVGQAQYTYSVPLPWGGTAEQPVNRATFWDGTGHYELATADQAFTNSIAYAVSGTRAVGCIDAGEFGQTHNATLWSIGANHSTTSVTLWSASESAAAAISGNLQGGHAQITIDADQGISANHAMVWHGTEASALDLNPKDSNNQFVGESDVAAVAENVKVGKSTFDVAVGNVFMDNAIRAVLWLIGDGLGTETRPFEMIELTPPELPNSDAGQIVETYATSIVLDDQNQIAAIYGYSVLPDGQGNIPLEWHTDSVGAQVPEAMTASLLLVGTCAMFLRRPRRA